MSEATIRRRFRASTRSSGRRIGFLLFLLLCPWPIIITTVSQIIEPPSSLVSVARVISLVITYSVSSFLLLWFPSNGIPNQVRYGSGVGLAALMICIIAISLVVNAVPMEDIAYGLLLAVHIAFVLCVLPLLANKFLFTPAMLQGACDAYLVLSGALLVTSLVYFLGSEGAIHRLGFPLKGGVFGYYQLIAVVVSAFRRRSPLITAVFVIAVLLSGSRSAAGLLVGLAVGHLVYTRRFRTLLAVGVLAIATVGIAVRLNEAFYRPYIMAREDVSSGRSGIWQTAIQEIRAEGLGRVIVGYGAPQQVEVIRNDDVREIGTHNVILDMTLAYGVLFALLGWMAWIARMGPPCLTYFSQGRDRGLFWAAVAIFLIVTSKALVTNHFWTNMADSATFFAVLFLFAANVQVRRRCPNRRRIQTRKPSGPGQSL